MLAVEELQSCSQDANRAGTKLYSHLKKKSSLEQSKLDSRQLVRVRFMKFLEADCISSKCLEPRISVFLILAIRSGHVGGCVNVMGAIEEEMHFATSSESTNRGCRRGKMDRPDEAEEANYSLLGPENGALSIKEGCWSACPGCSPR